ncbi:hypothetical protein CLAFUW4_08679 [Fulvia fulva]|nr:hypothetical protein CLAFUR4_08681 [Fulvia fulva]WPV12593.1 hypothetical protein CLAFUW4_08679 [Fulvia fulva]WPV27551.1 hypothetical protein CLAFUW7_08676 [Fulvia fulva]
MAYNQKMAFCDGLAKIAESVTLSDFTITCQGKKWPVHRVVLSLHSSVLGRACNGEFKQETSEKTHDLSAHELDHVEALIQYMYTFSYNGPRQDPPIVPPTFHGSIALLADKYDIVGLQELSNDKLRRALFQKIFDEDLANIIIMAYEAELATKAIRKTIVRHIVTQGLLGGTSEIEKALIEIMAQCPKFAVEVLQKQVAFSKELLVEAKQPLWKCPECMNFFREYIARDTARCECPHCGDPHTGRGWFQYAVTEAVDDPDV